jgi:hypothetical protein
MSISVDPNQSVADFIASLEKDIAEKTTLAALLKSATNVNDHAANLTSADTGAAPTKTDGDTMTLAERAKSILEAKAKPMSQISLRDEMKALGVSTDSKTFITTLYTTLKRRDDLFIRDADKNWNLVGWDIAITPKQPV